MGGAPPLEREASDWFLIPSSDSSQCPKNTSDFPFYVTQNRFLSPWLLIVMLDKNHIFRYEVNSDGYVQSRRKEQGVLLGIDMQACCCQGLLVLR